MIHSVRQIFTGSPQSSQQLRDCLTGLMVSLLIKPDEIWLVSAWVSDFELIDNRNFEWRMVCPHWSARMMRFSEVLADCVNQGCVLNLVTNDVQRNAAFEQRLKDRIADEAKGRFRYVISETLHTKGLLAHNFHVKGSMNFTFSGTNKNEEHVTITMNPDDVKEARLEFSGRYGKE